jgi:transcriptional regulator with XRE-family HTH domain
MVQRVKSPISDEDTYSSPQSDIAQGLAAPLREARLNRKLTQAELARKLGLRQRQISDLERATIDSRLSTIQNVARALGLELMLIPRHLISAVEALQRTGSDVSNRPLYALSDDDAANLPDEPPQPEVGDSRETSGPSHAESRQPKGRQQ